MVGTEQTTKPKNKTMGVILNERRPTKKIKEIVHFGKNQSHLNLLGRTPGLMAEDPAGILKIQQSPKSSLDRNTIYMVGPGI